VGQGREAVWSQGRIAPDNAAEIVAERFHLIVNGAERAIEADADAPLLYILRNDLGLKGTRFGCGSGQCGACFVLIDGHAAPACDAPLWSVAGKRITTVEGLASPGALHPLQEAFLAEQAAQCGYCTSGILISAAALLERNSAPSESEVRAALDRNLCRCGSHNRVVRAVLRAAGEP
jgi:nicotinate dehydrogenase subunit A